MTTQLARCDDSTGTMWRLNWHEVTIQLARYDDSTGTTQLLTGTTRRLTGTTQGLTGTTQRVNLARHDE